MKAEMAPTSALQATILTLMWTFGKMIQAFTAQFPRVARPSDTILCWHEMTSEKLEFKEA